MFDKNSEQKSSRIEQNLQQSPTPAVPAWTEQPQENNSSAIEPGRLYVIKREGKRVNFNSENISVAITKAYLATEGGISAQAESVHHKVDAFTKQVIEKITSRFPPGGVIHIEDIQDQVELVLMRAGEQKVARAYVLYREQHTVRRKESSAVPQDQHPQIRVDYGNGRLAPLDSRWLHRMIDKACENLTDVDHNLIYQSCVKNIYDEISLDDLVVALIISTHSFIEKEPNYSYVTARLQLFELVRRAHRFLGLESYMHVGDNAYKNSLATTIHTGIKLDLLNKELASFDLEKLQQAIRPERDMQFTFLGIKTLYDRYLLHWDEVRFEMPQVFFMRVAMGLAIKEDDKNSRAIEFYNLLSSFDYMSSTPTLFNAGTMKAQLSSCYLSTVPDDLDGIYNAIKDNALLSKWAGGLGNDWSRVRALGSYIKGTNGQSQGVIPFLKVANDTAVAVNQGGKRKGALCAYLETWHLDIESFLELRKNTGDDRRRTHDINTANWIPDLFMKRVFAEEQWTLFSPSDVPDLHSLTGVAFEKRYCEYETMVDNKQITNFKQIKAVALWRKMLSMLFETGHPWITFKDSCNLRSPQQHTGTIHSSNLCTEITLNTNDKEIAVCNLGSVNLVHHLDEKGNLNTKKLRTTVRTAIRMLDNVIDINYYSVPQARNSNLKHRPIGLGMMGFQDMLYRLKTSYASDDAVELADRTMEQISYYAIEASSDLALDRGCYESYQESLWSKGVLPLDSIQILARERGQEYLQVDTNSTLNWNALREKVVKQGMRNSNIMAIAPTATIANITGVTKSIEPTYQNLYATSNLSGEFTVINPYLVKDLKEHGIWDSAMINDLKFYDGSVQQIQRVPDDLKRLYKTAFEVGESWLIEAAARRQKWLDQAQSLNLYFNKPSGKTLDTAYKMAWFRGLKTTYYLRSLAATTTEKATTDTDKNSLNSVNSQTTAQQCSLDDDSCEACQ